MAIKILRLTAVLCLAVMAGGMMRGTAAAEQQEQRIDIGGYRINSVLVPRPAGADLPPLVFIHGAIANLRDPMVAFRTRLEGRAEMLFVDRPGHGGSDRGGPENDVPDGQADAVAAVMKARGISRAIIVSHSFGGAVAASFALRHKEMVAGLLFLSPAVYPYGGDTAWYYKAAKAPVTGWLFSGIVAPTVGLAFIDSATKAVFAPNPRPPGYISQTGTLSALRPTAFRSNAIDIANLSDALGRMAPKYPSIRAPTVIITGDRDGIVSPKVHALHLARDIRGATLVEIHNLGHRPDYIVTDVAIAAIEKLAGKKRDLQQLARVAEARIAGDKAD